MSKCVGGIAWKAKANINRIIARSTLEDATPDILRFHQTSLSGEDIITSDMMLVTSCISTRSLK